MGRGASLGSERGGEWEARIFPVIPVKPQTEKVYPHGIPSWSIPRVPTRDRKGDLSQPRVVVAPRTPQEFWNSLMDQPPFPWITHPSPSQGGNSLPKPPKSPQKKTRTDSIWGVLSKIYCWGALGAAGSGRNSHLRGVPGGSVLLPPERAAWGGNRAWECCRGSLCPPQNRNSVPPNPNFGGFLLLRGVSETRDNFKLFFGIATHPQQNSKSLLRGNPAPGTPQTPLGPPQTPLRPHKPLWDPKNSPETPQTPPWDPTNPPGSYKLP